MSDIEQTPETYWNGGSHVHYNKMKLHKAQMVREIAVQLKRIADVFEKLEEVEK